MNPLSKKSNIGFSQNIELHSVQTLEKAFEQGILVGGRPLHGKDIGSKSIYMCNAGGITGGNTHNNLVFHTFPDSFFGILFRKNLAALKQEFKKTVELLKKEKKEPEAFIFGGDGGFETSKHLLVVLKHLMEQSGINPTIFWGSGISTGSCCAKNIFYQGERKTWLANMQAWVGSGLPFADLTQKMSVLKSFEYIRVSPKDNIKFSDVGWVSGADGSLNKGELDISYKEVLGKYGGLPDDFSNSKK